MTEDELLAAFPDLDTTRRTPFLFRLNGCGCGFYNRRDHDEVSGTYRVTHCLCVLWLPVVPLATYRVADAAGGGWHVLGREPDTGGYRGVRNLGLLVLSLLMLGAVARVWWLDYKKTPAYQHSHALDKAARRVAQGELHDAVRRYERVLREAPDLRDDVAEGLADIADTIGPETPWRAAQGLLADVSLRDGTGRALVPDIPARVVAYVESLPGIDGEERVRVLDQMLAGLRGVTVPPEERERLRAIGAVPERASDR